MVGEQTCPHCGKPVPPSAPGGICPECLLKAGLASQSGIGPSESNKAPAPPKPEEIAPLFPQLEILACLGRGGMGVVYKARQPKLDRFVALKILARDRQRDPKFAERFAREAQALARLNHANIVTVYDFGEAGGHCYLLMEYVDGLSLRQLIQSGRMKAEEALTIVPPICEALQFAHELGVVHRDIKPENILLDKRGRVKIADFGIAKMLGEESGQPTLTGAKEIVGTPHYMAPEQIEKPQTVDHRADIYSLGVVFYEMLTGELPIGKFARPSQKVHVDVRLDEVVLRALEKEPECRYQHASVLKTDVETIATATSGSTPAQHPNPRKAMNTNINKPLWYGLGIGAVCLVVLGVWLLLPRGNPAQLAQQGWQLWQARQMTEAAAKFKQALKLDPNNVEAWNGLGWATFNSGNRQEAEKDFLKVIALDPNHPGALNGLGQIYLAEKKYDEAEKYLLQAAPKASAAWFGLARLYLLTGKYDLAEPWAQKLVDAGQGDETAGKMLRAAKDKHLSDSLRFMLEPK